MIVPELSVFILPCWSPDGCYFVTSGRDWQGRNGLFRIDAKTGDNSIIFEAEPDQPINMGATWSRQGKAVFFTQRNLGEGGQAIKACNLETGKVKELFRVAAPDYITM